MQLEGARGPRLADACGEVPAAGVTVLVGPSGAGKSSLLRLCNRLEVPDSGVVRFRGGDVASLDPLGLRRRVGMVFQRPTPFAGTVGDNLRVARSDLTRDAAIAVLTRVGLDAAFLDHPAGELSGGEGQRMCLARTLVTEPEVLLMDEPTSSLDPQSRLALEELSRTLVTDGVPILWVTHDFAQMRRLADQVLVMVEGSIAHAGPIELLDATAPPGVGRFLAERSEPVDE